MIQDKPKPVLIDKLTPELGGKVVALVQSDMERARRAAEQKKESAGSKGKRKKKTKRE